jgi:hypothetical protein
VGGWTHGEITRGGEGGGGSYADAVVLWWSTTRQRGLCAGLCRTANKTFIVLRSVCHGESCNEQRVCQQSTFQHTVPVRLPPNRPEAPTHLIQLFGDGSKGYEQRRYKAGTAMLLQTVTHHKTNQGER